jgi:hypothetical protein
MFEMRLRSRVTSLWRHCNCTALAARPTIHMMNTIGLSRLRRVWLMALLAGFLLAAPAASEDQKGANRAAPEKSSEPKERRREGTKFEGAGRFEITGDRVTFYPAEGQESFRVLENLALERVARVLGESREPRQWNVAGVFTEYQGGNYLLLSRAAVRQASKGAKDAVPPTTEGRGSPLAN